MKRLIAVSAVLMALIGSALFMSTGVSATASRLQESRYTLDNVHVNQSLVSVEVIQRRIDDDNIEWQAIAKVKRNVHRVRLVDGMLYIGANGKFEKHSMKAYGPRLMKSDTFSAPLGKAGRATVHWRRV